MIDELLDLVNENDEVIEQRPRSEVYAKKMCNFRVVNAFLVNSENKLWIPRRTKHKRVFPLCLDASMGGHVAAGESYKDALTRELMEELRINAHTHPCKHLGSLNPYQHNTSAFMQVYLLRTDTVPNYNDFDFIEYFWLHPQELLERLETGDKSKDDLPVMIRHLFL